MEFIMQNVNQIDLENLAVASIERSDCAPEKYLSFFIDDQLYAFKSRDVLEIISVPPLTYMPNLPHFVKGIINLRGKVIPVIDMRLMLKKTELEYGARTSIIVSQVNELVVGFIVDTVNEVTDIPDDVISSAAGFTKNTSDAYITGIATLQGKSVILFDVSHLLNSTGVSGEPAAPQSM